MPEMDGLEATRAIRALGGALGAHSDHCAHRQCFRRRRQGLPRRRHGRIHRQADAQEVLMEKLAMLLADHPRLAMRARPRRPQRLELLPVTPPAEVAMADVEPVLDRRGFDAFAEDIGLDGVRETLDVFLADTAERLALLRQLSCDTDRAKIKVEAHTLKGSSSTFGLDATRHPGAHARACGARNFAGGLSRSARPDRCGLRGGTSRSRSRDVREWCERGVARRLDGAKRNASEPIARRRDCALRAMRATLQSHLFSHPTAMPTTAGQAVSIFVKMRIDAIIGCIKGRKREG